MNKPLTKRIKYFYGIGDMFSTLAINVDLYLFEFFMINIAMFPLTTSAFIGTVTTLTSALLSIFYGVLITGTKEMKWGRNRSWMMVASPIAVFFYVLMFVKIGQGPVAVAVIIIAYIIQKFMMSVAFVAHESLVNVLANDATERGRLSSNRGTYMSAATVLYSYLGTPLAAFYAYLVGSQAASYPMLAATLGVIMIIAYYFTFKMTEGYETVGGADPHTGKPAGEKIPVKIMLKNVTQNSSLIALIFSEFMRYMGNFILVASLAYYFTYVVHDLSKMAIFLLVGGIVQVLGSFAAGTISKKFSTRNAAIIAMLGVGIAEILARPFGFNFPVVFGLLLVYKFFHGVGNSMYPALFADCAVFGHWKTGKNVASFIFGLDSITSKVAQLSRAICIPLVLSLVGFSAKIAPATASDAVRAGVLNMVVLIPGICTVIAGLILLFFYRLTKEKLAVCEQEIKEREALV